MKPAFRNILASFALMLYVLSIVGIGVHVCGSTGNSVLSLPYGSLDCSGMDCGDVCCDKGHNTSSSGQVDCPYCSTDIYSMSDIVDVSTPMRDMLRLPVPDVHLVASFDVQLSALTFADPRLSAIGRPVPISAEPHAGIVVLRI